MRATVVLTVVMVLTSAGPAFAQQIGAVDGRDVTLFRAVDFREVAARTQAPPATPREGWAARHPVLLGTLIGAGAGLIIEHNTCGVSSCNGLVAATFTGAGTWGGLIASAVHKKHQGQPVSRTTKIGLVLGAIGAGVGAFLYCYGAGGCGGVS